MTDPTDQDTMDSTSDKCVFCKKIAANDIEAHADGMVIFTPLNPVVEGHKLFVHTQHTTNAVSDPKITGLLFEYASYYGKGKQFNLITSAGTDATQTIMHTHAHYVPRTKADGLQLPWSDQANATASKLASALASQRTQLLEEAMAKLPTQKTDDSDPQTTMYNAGYNECLWDWRQALLELKERK